ncbi:MAG TPA: hypothetical protein VIV60_11890, partial [Polyangiaceae bacterium]
AASESLGDLDSAISICRGFLETAPENHAVRLRLAAALLRHGRMDEVAQEIGLLDVQAIRGVHRLSILAQTLMHLGRPQEAIELAYRMRAEHIDDVEAHIRYVTLYSGARHHLPDVDHDGVVALGQAVQLSGPGALGWVLLCNSSEGNVSEKEYPKTHELSRLLVGKRVGEKIHLPSVGTEWVVAAIGSRFGFAFAQTLERFPAHFPTNTKIQQQTVPTDTEELAEHFKKQFEASNACRDSVISHYRAGRCGVGSVASMLNRSGYDTIPTILASPGGVACCTNFLDEQNYSLGLLQRVEVTLLLDLTAIFALEHIGALRDGTLSKRRLAVAQRTIDELFVETVEVQHPPPEGRMQIGLVGTQLVKFVITAEEMREAHQNFVDLVGWLRSNAVIAPIAPSVAEKYAGVQDMDTMLGQSFWDSIRAANSIGSVLISDDLWLRCAARSLLRVDGTCSAMLLMSELQAGRLARSRYDELMVKLIAAGYQRLPIDATILEAAVRSDHHQSGGATLKALASLHGPAMMSERALSVGAHFIQWVWLNVGSLVERTALLVAVLEALLVGREPRVLKWFAASIWFSTALHPRERDEILRIVDACERTRIVHA